MSPEDRRAQAAAPAEPFVPEEGSPADVIQKAFPAVAIQAAKGVQDVLLTVDRKAAHDILVMAKQDPQLSFDFLRDLCGVDYESDGLEVVYQLFSHRHHHAITLKAKVPIEDPVIQSATDIWAAADWHEREVRDMFGIVFEGHPNLVPLLLPDDMLDHFPLRKDNPLAPLEEWQGEFLGDNMASAGHIPPGSGFNVEASAEGE